MHALLNISNCSMYQESSTFVWYCEYKGDDPVIMTSGLQRWKRLAAIQKRYS